MCSPALPGRTLLGCVLVVVFLGSIPPAETPAQEETTPLDRAKQSYEAGEYGKAITELEAALVHPSNYSQEELASIYLHLGLAYLAFDRTDRAQQAFAESLRLDTEIQVDPTLRSPEVEETFQRARWVVEDEWARTAGEESDRTPLGQAIEIPMGPTGKTRWGGVWRSSLFPGWGQHYGGRKKRGYAFMAGEIAAVSASIYATVERERAYDEYQEAKAALAVDRVNALYDDYRSWRRTRDTFLIVAGGIWALNILERFLNDPSLPPKEDRAMGSWRLGAMSIEPTGWAVRICRTF